MSTRRSSGQKRHGQPGGVAPAATTAPVSRTLPLGVLLTEAVRAFQQRDFDRVLAIGRQILAAFPNEPDALHLMALACRQKGQGSEALAFLQQSLTVRPQFAEGYYNLGNLLVAQGNLTRAIQAYQVALALKPDQVDGFKNLGNSYQNMGMLAPAMQAYHAALRLDPQCRDACNNIAAALQSLGRFKDAALFYQSALAIDPGYAEAWNNLGMSLATIGRLREGCEAMRRALALRPGYAECWSNYAGVLFSQGLFEETMAAYRQALSLRPDFLEASSNYLLSFNYIAGVSAREVFSLYQQFDARHMRPLAPPPGTVYPQPRMPEKRLRIGYFSPDFRRHSCAFFFMPLLTHRNREAVEVSCYAYLKNPDAYSERIRALADHWIPVTGESAERLAERIRADQIDIMVDMAGHFADHRLAAFARKPAPVQATWLGYPNTTGLSAIDYRFTDAWADPPGEADALHSETLIRLPRGFLCYVPPDDAAPVVPPPCLGKGRIAFGSFNNLNKVTPQVLALWAAVLRAVPGSELVLKALQLSDPETSQRICGLLTAQGVAPERVRVLPWSNHPADHMPQYGEMDIALDPFPYNGTTTTCEALWMGVPVVALEGGSHAGRVCVSLLERCGLGALVGKTPTDYVRIAASLAANPAQLLTLRTSMRARVSASPLGDQAGFARQMEEAYRQIWQRWCAGADPMARS